MTDAIFRISPVTDKTRVACEVRGRQLAPAIWQLDNQDDVEETLELGCLPCEEWTFDPRSGIISIPGVGGVRIGGYIVADGHAISVYGSLDELLARYDVIEDIETSRRRDGKTRIRTGKTA